MRLAIFSALAENPDRSGERLAFRRFAGRSVLAHQIDCAAQLGCEKVIVLATGLGHELLTAQRHCERAGMRFQPIDGISGLSSTVTADDTVLLIADGVLPDRQILVDKLATHPAILSFPADDTVGLGYERIDSRFAWSGALRTRGERIARLMDLPSDIDMASALLRVSLQAGTRIVPLDSALVFEGIWQRRVDRNADPEIERRWLRHHVAPAPFFAPGLAIAERTGMRLAHDISGSRWERAPLLVSLSMAGAAALSGIFGHAAIGLGIAWIAMVALAVSGVFDRVARVGKVGDPKPRFLPALRMGADGLILYLLTLSIPAELGWLRVFVPVILLGLLRLGEWQGARGWRAIYGDRILLLAVLVPFALTGHSMLACAVLALIVLASLFFSAEDNRLTAI